MAGTGFLTSLGSAVMRGAAALLTPAKSKQGGSTRTGTGGTRTSTTMARPAGRGADAAAGQTIAVGYQPRKDGHPDPGEVVWTWVPFEDDPSQGKDRPVIAIGWVGSSLAIVPFTSKDQHGRADTYELGVGPWDSSGRSSWVKLDRLIGVDPDAVRREGATLDKARFDDLIRRLHAAHGAVLRVTS